MAFPSVTFSNELDPVVRKEFEQFASLIQGWMAQEHDSSGKHTRVTALALDLATNPAIPGDDELTIGGGDEQQVSVVGTIILGRNGKQVVRIVSASGTPKITAVGDNAQTTAKKGAVFVLQNNSGTAVTIVHESGGYQANQRWNNPGGVDYVFYGKSMLFCRFDFAIQRWTHTGQYRDIDPAFLVNSGDICIRESACPVGWTRVGDLDDKIPMGGLVADVGTLSGTASVTPTFSGTPGGTSNDSAGTPAGSVSQIPAHAHGGLADTGTLTAVAKFENVDVGGGIQDIWAWDSNVGTNDHQHPIPEQAAVNPTFTGSALGTHGHTMTPAGDVSAVSTLQPARKYVFCRKD